MDLLYCFGRQKKGVLVVRIDTAKFCGPCACGAEHQAVTRLCIIEAGALSRFDDLLAEAGIQGKRCAVYDGNT